MYAVDRKYFIDLPVAYIDAPQKLGFGATISAPHMVFVFVIFVLYIYYIDYIVLNILF